MLILHRLQASLHRLPRLLVVGVRRPPLQQLRHIVALQVQHQAAQIVTGPERLFFAMALLELAAIGSGHVVQLLCVTLCAR